MLQYLASHYIELLGTLCSLIYLVYAIPGKPALWVWGIISAALYIVVFYNGKFYADMTLQFYYLGVSIYGLYNWLHYKKPAADTYSETDSKTKADMPISRTPAREWVYLAIASALIFVAYYLVLNYLTDSSLPVCDSLTTALSITATWMLTQKRIEYWLVFVFVDAFSACLYAYRGLYPSALLFIIYTVMAIIGYRRWHKELFADIETKYMG